MYTPLLIACKKSTAELVSLLLAHGAAVDVRGSNGDTPLHHAAYNGAFGRDIIPLLLAAGADANAENLATEKPLLEAMANRPVLAELLLPFTSNAKRELTYIAASDPMRSLSIRSENGLGGALIFDAPQFQYTSRWTGLRTGEPFVLDGSARDVYQVLATAADVRLWKWASNELPQQHPLTGDTLFHALCRNTALSVSDKLAVLADLKSYHRNPLAPNRKGELCVELAKEAELKQELGRYMTWQPNRFVTHWFGPLFRKRAFALLLVCNRMRKEHPKRLSGISNDIRHLLVRYASKAELIYVK